MKRIFATASAALLLAACNSKAPSKQEQLKQLQAEQQKLTEQISKLEASMGATQPTANKIVPVAVTPINPTLFKNYIEVQGKVDAEENINVTAEVPAVVTALYAVVGQHVTKGQVLAQLDDRVIRDGIAQLQSQLDFAKNLYEKQKNLWAQNIGTEVQLLSAKNNYENLEKQIGVQTTQLNMYKVKSPINGVVDEVDIKVGQAVSPGLATMRVVNDQKLKVKGQIGETFVTRVHQGDNTVLIFPDANDTLHTRLTYVSRVIDPVSRSFNVEINLPSSRVYHANMIAVIKVVSYTNSKALVVPLNVIQKAEDGSYVYVIQDNKAQKARVNVGQVYNGQAEILSGLKAGDQVVTTGFQDLDQGDTVNIAN